MELAQMPLTSVENGLGNQKPIYVVEASKGIRWPKWGELWVYRELAYFLAWRDVKVRYKQTTLGIAWAILQPLMLMLVFTLFLGGFARLPSEGYPYALFVLTGLTPWIFFSTSIAFAANSLYADGCLINKVYFPRIIIPCARVFGCGIDFVVSLLLLLGVSIYFGFGLNLRWFLLPLFSLLLLALTLGIALCLSSTTVLYRDARHVIPLLIQLWLFSTPVAYSAEALPYGWKILYALNPLVGVVEGFRWVIFGNFSDLLVISLTVAIILTIPIGIAGMLFFRSIERSLADTL